MTGSRFKLNQNHAPIHEALETFRRMRVVPFDVPGHKRGRGNPELTEFLGQKCVGVDVNSMQPLDNLCHPVSVIREAEELAADAFGAAHAFLMVGGTTSSVQTMVLTACKRGDEIILPRNVHRSVLCCGPDSLMVERISRRAKQFSKPVLHLTVDEQTGEAGFITRLEAFVDMLFRKKRATIINKIDIDGKSEYIPNTNFIETK